MKAQNKIITSLTTFIILSSMLNANAGSNDYSSVKLTKMEAHSLALAKKFINGKDKSFYRPDGGVVFLHGGTMPSLLTAPLRLTDIQLQAGEVIKEVQLGDTVRWQVSPSISGSGSTQVSHVLVKPTDVGLQTTLDIFTDRRSYHINLKSTKSKYFPIVSFGYADELKPLWDKYQENVKQNQLAKTMTIDDRGVDINSLDFNYEISGSAKWKPSRVFNNGKKTFIVMPESMNANEAPVLLALDHSGTEQIVNYRLVNNKYEVDKLFDKAILILGVGSSQSKITITKTDFVSNQNIDNLKILEVK